MSDVKFKVSGISETPARISMEARSFNIVIDEPPALGGNDFGPNPVEYILAGLAGCINVLGHLVAKEMDFEIKQLEVEIEGKLNPDKLFGKPTEDRSGFKFIVVTLKVDADASEKILAKWIKTVEARCPVSDNISHSTPVFLYVNPEDKETVNTEPATNQVDIATVPTSHEQELDHSYFL